MACGRFVWNQAPVVGPRPLDLRCPQDPEQGTYKKTAGSMPRAQVPQMRGPGRNWQPSGKLVGVEGFEPPALWSQTRCATRLRYTPTAVFLTALSRLGKRLFAGPGRDSRIK